MEAQLWAGCWVEEGGSSGESRVGQLQGDARGRCRKQKGPTESTQSHLSHASLFPSTRAAGGGGGLREGR
jgi:hypothetical protein